MIIEETSRTVSTIRMEWGAEQSQTFLLLSDVHWDNPHCNRDLLKKDLDEAVEREAGILTNGDIFCLMQGKYDKRKAKSDIREEHNNDSYLDSVVETAIDYFGPYAENLINMTMGNHEASILKHIETNVTERLVQGINTRYKPKQRILFGGYSGWVLFRFMDGNGSMTKRLKYSHGGGGHSPVTEGVIGTKRRAAYLPDADIIWTGHLHQKWYMPDTRERLTAKGNIHEDRIHHIQTGTYKDEFFNQHLGFAIERQHPPQDMGGWWLTLTCNRGGSHEGDKYIGVKVEDTYKL